MSDASAESLLKSALEKIVYFEARSTQLSNDLDGTRAEVSRLKDELGQAAQREIELRRLVAELEVRSTRAHSEREETARVAEALQRERAELIGKMLDASRIQGQAADLDGFDLAQFIAELRSEVLVQRDGTPVHLGPPPSAPNPAPAPVSHVTTVARSLQQQGRLEVSAAQLSELSGAKSFPGRSEETLFGFSVRELAAPDPASRARAAERLKALAHPAAAPALASALMHEQDPVVLAALLGAIASLARVEALPVVTPHLASPAAEVRVAALRALLTLDATQASPHLAAAMKDPDRTVRRRASMLALSLNGADALALGTQAIGDTDADVRSLAALVLGASGAEAARSLLLKAMRDGELRVRRAASQALSRLLGRDVTGLVELEDAHRRREVRRLSSAPSRPVHATAQSITERLQALSPRSPLSPQRRGEGEGEGPSAPAVSSGEMPVTARPLTPTLSPALRGEGVRTSPQAASIRELVTPAAPQRARTAVLEVEVDAAPQPLPAHLGPAVLTQLRAAIRGRAVDELARDVGASAEDTRRACVALVEQGQLVRRGLKYFVA